ncbi:cysteine-rich CWC family protein [Paenactinomyces guangxiensis]|uniref:Cysteine-rich CWC family protein n=1 Tax=Paenactinomyces guangxiensis TaxID=1490290 RepID=A0A7W2A7J8_9BACL|nr:cysteine-rich CWC family protein [Paenactinomyces guangxiensis]MBA4494641.1 cysteine-rich CWC family protein [Paenactinomyces guangxiensis]MBH8591596.1 cysteine-rich CWC family protein [Paenactinomyces guangxiensis]
MTEGTTNPANCPICGKDNNCGNLADKPQGTCWCSKEIFPWEIFELVPAHALKQSCICKGCLEKFKAQNSL